MTQPPEPPPPPDDAWPTPDEPTVIASRETVVDGRPPEPVGPPPDRRIGAGMLLALGALALVALGILIAWYLTHRDDDKSTTTVVTTVQGGTTAAAAQVAVPRLVGLKEQEALTRLAQLELRPKEVFKPTSKANGLVVSQKPQEATQVPKGSRVTLVIDKGAPNVAVPDLTGTSFSEAQAKLDAAGLDSTKTEVTSDQPAGTVVDQAPKAGAKVAKGSTVTLSVARGAASTTTAPATTTSGGTTTTTAPTTTAPTTTAAPAQPTSAKMPDVTGQTEQAAVTAMNRAGVLASLVFVPADDPLGTVLQQAKPAGTTVPFHSHVQINVSKGPNAATDVTV